jgi:hypothetical protein
MILPQLPQEIIDEIIGNVDRSDSDEVLASCALVSKVFRPPAQRLRFNQITLDDRRLSQLERFSQILTHNPTLGEYVQNVNLVYRGFRNPCTFRTTQMVRALEVLEQVLGACRIKVLVLPYGTYSKSNIHLLSPRTLPNLRRLNAAGASFLPKILLHNVVAQHPPLDHLELSLADLSIIDNQWSPGRELVCVNQLHIHAGNYEIKDNSTLRMMHSGVEELKISISSTWALEIAVHVNQILEVLGVMLRHLQLYVNGSLRESVS